MRRHTLRPLGIIALAVVIMSSGVVLRANALSDFCNYWSATIFPPDDFWCLSNHSYSWYGGYDISSYGDDAPMQASFICDDLIFSCWELCDSSAYRSSRAQYYSDQTGGQCSYAVECVDTWAGVSCQQSNMGTFLCSCNSMNLCMPC